MNPLQSQSGTAVYPEQKIVDAILARLEPCGHSVLLGYSATGVDDSLSLPAILVQLESIHEENRQGDRVKARMEFSLGVVVRTGVATTHELLQLARTMRTALGLGERLCPEARKIQLSDTQFDIAPSHGQLSFADIQLSIEVII